MLILLHNDPDPDAMASGLALRNVLRRTKTTAIIGAIQGVTRPENLRMVNLLDIHVEPITAESLKEFDRMAMVDVQPHYFGGLIDRVDLVIDHHPEQPGYTAVFKDIRADYGSTSTILTEHLRAVDVNISERTATAMLYAIKSDTLFFNRQTNRVDIEAFSYLYPLADAALIRKMEGAEITLERLDYVMKAHRAGTLVDQVFCGFIGATPREDFIPYVADFFLQLEDVKWTVIAGDRQRLADRLGAEPRLLEERRRVRAPVLRRHRQRRRPPRDGQGGGADARVPREVRRRAGRGHRPPAARARRAVPARSAAGREAAGDGGSQKLTPALAAALPLTIALAVNTADQRTRPGAERVRPPEGFECPLDWTTVYIGSVTRLTRERDRTILDIRTDWDTTERVVVSHAGSDGPDRWFLLRGKPFAPDGWTAIESKPGQLRPGMRASAWVCLDRQNPVVDWNPAAEPQPPPVR